MRRAAAFSLAIVVLVSCSAAGAVAQTPDPPEPPDPREARPERPTVAAHAYAVAAGIVEVEAGIQWQRPDPASSQLVAPVLVKMGLGRGVQLDINVGYTRRSGDGSVAPRSATVWAVSAGIPVRGSLGWGAEVFRCPGTSGPSGTAPVVAFLAGPTFALRRSVVLDAGVVLDVAGFGGTAVYSGVTWNVGRLPVRGAAGRVAR